jgi:hypothetical protein
LLLGLLLGLLFCLLFCLLLGVLLGLLLGVMLGDGLALGAVIDFKEIPLKMFLQLPSFLMNAHVNAQFFAPSKCSQCFFGFILNHSHLFFLINPVL